MAMTTIHADCEQQLRDLFTDLLPYNPKLAGQLIAGFQDFIDDLDQERIRKVLASKKYELPVYASEFADGFKALYVLLGSNAVVVDIYSTLHPLSGDPALPIRLKRLIA